MKWRLLQHDLLLPRKLRCCRESTIGTRKSITHGLQRSGQQLDAACQRREPCLASQAAWLPVLDFTLELVPLGRGLVDLALHRIELLL